jgi:hypothetical protein
LSRRLDPISAISKNLENPEASFASSILPKSPNSLIFEIRLVVNYGLFDARFQNKMNKNEVYRWEQLNINHSVQSKNFLFKFCLEKFLARN